MAHQVERTKLQEPSLVDSKDYRDPWLAGTQLQSAVHRTVNCSDPRQAVEQAKQIIKLRIENLEKCLRVLEAVDEALLR